MKRCTKFLFIFFLFSACWSLSADTFQVNRSGRRVQLDGFLMDWIEQERRAWDADSGWVYDAINTPEGVAGYFLCGRAQCEQWTFFIDPSRLKARPWRMQTPDTAGVPDAFHRANHTLRDSSHVLALEWVIPWDSISVDSGGTYAMRVAGISSCGDSLQPLLITGSLYSMIKRSPLPAHFTERIIVIVALLVIFIVLQLRIRKKTRRRGSPRRSA